MQTSPYKNLETKNFYVDYPHDALSALSKWYCECLFCGDGQKSSQWRRADVERSHPVQISLKPPVSFSTVAYQARLRLTADHKSRSSNSVWLQQLVVLNLEEHRKDYAQMFTHHVVTVLLMTFSYVLNWTRVGNAILCIMDFVDILLPVRPFTFFFLLSRMSYPVGVRLLSPQRH